MEMGRLSVSECESRVYVEVLEPRRVDSTEQRSVQR
jgi:hypothetical protein